MSKNIQVENLKREIEYLKEDIKRLRVEKYINLGTQFLVLASAMLWLYILADAIGIIDMIEFNKALKIYIMSMLD